MSTDVAVRETDITALDALTPEAREMAITSILEQSKEWLVRASMATDPAREVANFKAFITTVAEAAKQKRVSEEIQMEAQVMVRRSERALGVAIREGQEQGEIETAREARTRAGLLRQQNVENIVLKPKPLDYVSADEMRGNGAGIHHLTENVSDEQFEEALSQAAEEGNVSRANVVRKIRGDDSPRKNTSRRDHLLTLQKVTVSLSAYADVAAQILDEGLDGSVTNEEAATLHDDLSKALHTLNRIKRELNTRKAL